MKEMTSIESALFNILALAGGVLIIIVCWYTYDTYVPQINQQQFAANVSWLVANGMVVAAFYMLFTALAGLSPQTHPKLYLAAHFASIAAFLAINYTFGCVIYQFIQSGQQIRALADVPGSMHLIIMLFAFSWLNVLWLERRKHRALLKYEEAKAIDTQQPAVQGGLAVDPFKMILSLGQDRVGPFDGVMVEVLPSGYLLLELPGLDRLGPVPKPQPVAA